MPRRQHVLARHGLRVGSVDGEERDHRAADPDHRRNVTPRRFVSPLQAQNLAAPLRRCADISHGEGDVSQRV